MEIEIIEERIKDYKPTNKEDELNAFKEIVQEITLSALSRAEFFKHAAFQGGTCLRIVHGLNRFSEDLDFVLNKADPDFQWNHFFREMELEFSGYGLQLEVKDRSKATDTVKKAFLKENSFGKVLKLIYERTRFDTQVVNIKLEIDTNPPMGSGFETKVIRFPEPFSIVAQDLPSLYAGKMHALLCREYTKGRDWFDFLWYVSKKIELNFLNLQNALFQQGPWKGLLLTIDKEWVKKSLQQKIKTVDWVTAKKDIQPFLRPQQLRSLDLWSEAFFLELLVSL
ncbi:MAG: nucleotidyl transferase AbiEii/AbiGii toxin family protein [Parachlamydiaceae bacterium]